ncbi:gluconokinase [Nitratireductor sp. ZSWI3]|uniref:gluconokinase n=1 Tax=Nitratireductor sp. ZSWI3 TaxID=2966359 RepID=UPI0021503F72|nr:gluconokinase [Nitratireductor sp. ZSWI3]MCR4264646.1 gluconokinase [Nitratireductor sp. ZSWI3]
MGVCGVGKSTVARRLAEACGGHFLEGDAFHAPESIRAMSQGTPLTDEMRLGWLERIAQAVGALNAGDEAPVMIACSALKRGYRDHLRERIGPLALLYLHGDPDLIRQRLVSRKDHFMPAALLESQLRDLEPPDAVSEQPTQPLDVAQSVEALMDRAIGFCRRQGASAGGPGPQEHARSAGRIHEEN